MIINCLDYDQIGAQSRATSRTHGWPPGTSTGQVMCAVITEVVRVIGVVTQSPTAETMVTVPVKSPVSGAAEATGTEERPATALGAPAVGGPRTTEVAASAG